MFVTAGISSRQQLEQSQSYTSSRILLGSARINDPSFLVGPYQTTHNLFSTFLPPPLLLLTSTAEKPNHLNCSLRVPEKRANGPTSFFMTAMRLGYYYNRTPFIFFPLRTLLCLPTLRSLSDKCYN